MHCRNSISDNRMPWRWQTIIVATSILFGWDNTVFFLNTAPLTEYISKMIVLLPCLCMHACMHVCMWVKDGGPKIHTIEGRRLSWAVNAWRRDTAFTYLPPAESVMSVMSVSEWVRMPRRHLRYYPSQFSLFWLPMLCSATLPLARLVCIRHHYYSPIKLYSIALYASQIIYIYIYIV